MKRLLLSLRVVFLALILSLASSSQAQNYLLNEDFNNFPSTITSVSYNGWSSTTAVGDSTFDKWLFDNPYGYSVPAPMTGQAGIVDCYNAGQPGSGSNGGRAQSVYLNAPSVNTVGLTNLTLTFDHMFMRLSTPTVYVEVSTNGGSTWTQVANYSTVSFFSQSVTLNLDSYVGNADTRVRFFWENLSTATTQGYWMLDNVKLFSRYANDVGIEAVVLPMNNSCPDLKQPLSVTVTNFGTASASNIDVDLIVSGGTSGSFNTTITSLAAGASVNVFTGDSINTTAGGNFNFIAMTTMTGDQTFTNDSMNVTRVTAPKPTDPSGPTITQCGVGEVNLSCSSTSGESTVWYNDSVTNASMGDGNPYQTNFVTYASRRFYAENTRNLPSEHTTYTTGVYRYNTAAEKGIFFDISTSNEVVLDSFASNWAYAGDYVINVYYKTGTYATDIFNSSAWTLLGTDTVSPLGLGQVATINPKASLRIGTGETYGFVITSRPLFSGLPPFAFKAATSNVSNEDMTIYSNTVAETVFSNSLTGYSADVNVYYQKVCKSPRKGIDVVIIPKPAGVEAAATAPYNGFYNSGSPSNPDYAKIHDTVTYELLAPTGYTYADYGTKWMISGMSFQTANGTGPITSDTATFNPTSSVGAALRFVPSDYIDSVFIMEVTVLDILKNCDTTIQRNVIVAAEPYANFSAPSACEGDKITFVNNSSVLSGVLSYKWYFGDGDSSDLTNPSHTYQMAGTYDVTVIATTNYGFATQFDSTVTVYQIPQAEFLAQNACEGADVTFTDASLLPSGTPTYTWDFGDGSASGSGPNPSHAYAVAGSYTVNMTVEVNGCSDSYQRYATQAARAVPAFTSSSNCNNANAGFSNGTTLAFGTYGSLWKFGDGTNSGAQSPNHLYAGFGTFDVTLIVTTDLGCIDSISNQVTLVESPIVDFSMSNACSEEQIDFVNLTNVPAGGANNYFWDFNNVSTSQSVSPSYIFTAPGAYTIKLKVDNSNGCSDSITRIVNIDTKPIASIAASDVCEGNAVIFDNNTVNIPNGAVYVWDFGNGQFSSAFDTSYMYANPGAYDVNLYASTSNGCIDTASKTINVNENPDASFSFSSALLANGTMSFSGPMGTGYIYQWDMGDGSKYQVRDFDHKYILNGTYSVVLTVTSDKGCVSQTTQMVSSNPSSVGNMAEVGIRVYPNPTRDNVNVDLSALSSANSIITVRDLTGKELIRVNSNSEDLVNLDFANFAEGSYIIIVQTENAVYSTKVQLIK